MTSNIDPTVPIFGTPTTQSVRDNFVAAKSEIEALQGATTSAPFLPLAGGTLTGSLVLAADPTAEGQAATKNYVDNAVAGGSGGTGGVPEAPLNSNTYGRSNATWIQVLPLSGGTLSGALAVPGNLNVGTFVVTGTATLAANPTTALEAATKQYVDAIAIPAGGSTGQLLAKTATGYGWDASGFTVGAANSGGVALSRSGAAPLLWIESFGSQPAAPTLALAASNGTPAAPSPLVINNNLGVLQFTGQASASAIVAGVQIVASATQNWSGSANGARLVFGIIPTNATVTAAVLTLQNGVQIGAPAGGDLGAGTLNVQGTIQGASATIAGLLTAGSLTVNGLTQINSNLSCASLTATGNLNATSGSVSAAALTITGSASTGNLNCASLTAGSLTVNGLTQINSNLTTASIDATGNINATGNITSNASIQGDGAQFSNSVNLTSTGIGGGIIYEQHAGNSVHFAWLNPMHIFVDTTDLGAIQIVTSDARIKRDIKPTATDALAVLEQVDLFSFERRDGLDDQKLWRRQEIGFIAQELQEVLPEAILGDPDGKALLGVDLLTLVAYAVRAIQQLSVLLAALEGR